MFKLLKNPLILIIFTIITIIFYISLSRTQRKSLDTLSMIEKSEQEKQLLEQKKTDLEEKLQNIDSEKIIRDEFLMQKPGEYVVKVPLPDEYENKKSSINQENSNLQKWLEVLTK